MIWNQTTMILLIPALLLAMYAQFRVSSTFQKYLRVPSRLGYTGAEVARAILDRNGLDDVHIERVPGTLTDHYDPRTNILRLSDAVYDGRSIASTSVAAHEVGHAIQQNTGYAALKLRNFMAPTVAFASNFVMIIVLAGLFLSIPSLLNFGILLFTLIVAFQVVTLPVEFNASRRAIANLQNGLIAPEEERGARSVLSAAALTYVAGTLVALAQLIGLLAGRRRN